MSKHHPDDCPKRKTGSCGCDGAYDDGCPKCTPSRHTDWCDDCSVLEELKIIQTIRRTIVAHIEGSASDENLHKIADILGIKD